MSLTCALSGQVPEEPVISPVSGSVFERRLITKHIDDQGTDPVSGDALSADQLVAVKTSPIVRPRAADATSIPGLIKLFQDEWDASVLETYKLREYVHKLRQELSHTVYQHDAACRVIARLTRERDEARAALGMLKPSAAVEQQQQPAAAAAAGGAADSNAMETDDAAAADAEDDDGMTAAVLSKITSTSKTLSKARKKRVAKPEGLATVQARLHPPRRRCPRHGRSGWPNQRAWQQCKQSKATQSQTPFQACILRLQASPACPLVTLTTRSS